MLQRLFLILALAFAPAAAFAASVGKPAPKYTIVDYEGREVSHEALRGKVVVLNYWATWCAPCRNEMPAMDTYMRRHRNKPLAIYAITVDNQVPYTRLKFLDDSLIFPLVRKLKGGGYGVKEGVPTTYIIDKSGIVRHAKAGALDLAKMEALITPLLNAPDPPAETAGAAPQAVASAR